MVGETKLTYILVMIPPLLQVCVWNSDGWEKQKSRFLQLPAGRTPSSQSDTRVQFHQDQTHFLVVHETQLAIFETTKLECVKQVCVFDLRFMYLKISRLASILCVLTKILFSF